MTISAADQNLAYKVAIKARATAEEMGCDPVLMLCELHVLRDRETMARWVDGGLPKDDATH